VADERNRVPVKRLVRSIELIEKVIASDPERAIPILEEGINLSPAEAIGFSWIVNEQFDVVTVVPVQPKLRAKPDEALNVLYDLVNFCSRQPLGCGETCESDVPPINDRQWDWSRIHARLWVRACRRCDAAFIDRCVEVVSRNLGVGGTPESHQEYDEENRPLHCRCSCWAIFARQPRYFARQPYRRDDLNTSTSGAATA
jgi:hypothetical protein